MFQLSRYNLRSIRIPKLHLTRLWLSTSKSESSPIQGVVQPPMNTSVFQPYDVIVVGGGHAGCEGKKD